MNTYLLVFVVIVVIISDYQRCQRGQNRKQAAFSKVRDQNSLIDYEQPF